MALVVRSEETQDAKRRAVLDYFLGVPLPGDSGNIIRIQGPSIRWDDKPLGGGDTSTPLINVFPLENGDGFVIVTVSYGGTRYSADLPYKWSEDGGRLLIDLADLKLPIPKHFMHAEISGSPENNDCTVVLNSDHESYRFLWDTKGRFWASVGAATQPATRPVVPNSMQCRLFLQKPVDQWDELIGLMAEVPLSPPQTGRRICYYFLDMQRGGDGMQELCSIERTDKRPIGSGIGDDPVQNMTATKSGSVEAYNLKLELTDKQESFTLHYNIDTQRYEPSEPGK